MITQIWITQMILALVGAVPGTELLPEKYLKPKDFNYHPFTDVGIPATLKKPSKLSTYALLLEKRARDGEVPPQNIVYYPTPHPSVISKKQIETNEISKYEDPYINAPKNYAFSYIVKDQHSGDDFSHSQAHNGKATRGQYRVKLPDGRTQIVSYTADHKGYRADVQYEEEFAAKPYRKQYQSVQNAPETPAKLPEILPHAFQKHRKPSAEVLYTPVYKVEPTAYLNPTTPAPLQYVSSNTPLSVLVNSQTVSPTYYHPHYSQKYLTPTAVAHLQEQYVPSTSAQHLPRHYVSSTPLYPVQASTTAAPPTYEQQQYHISSTVSPQHAIIVTPRPISTVNHHEGQSSSLLYRLV